MRLDQAKSVPRFVFTKDLSAAAYALAIVGSVSVSWLVTLKVGGTGVVDPYWMYIPIMLCAYRFAWPTTLVTSVGAALVVGPLMPDHFTHGQAVPQAASLWLSRGGGFVILGQVVAALFRHLRRQRDAARAALRDPLTGLSNRVLFLDRLAHSLNRLDRRGGVLGVLFLDLDDFKAVNDGQGHGVGDELLVAISERLRDAVRGEDTLARLSGDEFAVVVESADMSGITRVAERLLQSLQLPFSVGGRPTEVHVSIGIATTTNGNVTARDLLRHADVAMYSAKRAGKNRYDVFPPELVAAG